MSTLSDFACECDGLPDGFGIDRSTFVSLACNNMRMSRNGYTTIAVTEDVADRLYEEKGRSESWDDVMIALLENNE